MGDDLSLSATLRENIGKGAAREARRNDLVPGVIYGGSDEPLNINVKFNELLKKLDNILFLLEEQRESEKHLITEELILYVFLGVFIIYVLDCFVKAGKYVR